MSRGGRGGGRGGYGGLRVSGGAIPFDIGADLEAEYEKLSALKTEKTGNKGEDEQAEYYPEYNVPIADPPTARERKAVAHYRALRARIHDGPFFAVLDPNARVSKDGRRSAPQSRYDPFEDVSTYGSKHVRKSRVLPNLKTRPFVKEFFPKELWATIGVAASENGNPNAPAKKLAISTKAKIDKLAQFDEGADAQPDGDADNDDEAMNNDDEDQAEVEQPQDDEFDEDEDDLGDDYNAEQYFDAGEDDYEDGGGDDGGGDEGY